MPLGTLERRTLPNLPACSGCIELFPYARSISCYVQIQLLPRLQESMPVAVNHAKLRNTLAVTEFVVGKNSILVFTVFIVFLTQTSRSMNGNTGIINLSGFIPQTISLYRFYHSDVRGYLADLGRKRRPVFTRQPLHKANVWIVILDKRRYMYYLQNNATQRYVCFTRRGRPRLLHQKTNWKCDLDMRITGTREEYFYFRHRATRWALGFCPNGRPFIATRPNSRRCSIRTRNSRHWMLLKRCTARAMHGCDQCRDKPADFVPCRACQESIICNPGRLTLSRSVLESLKP